MRKRLAFLLILAMLFTVFASGSLVLAAGKTVGSTFVPSLPSFEKPDPDMVRDASAAGVKVAGKELRGYNGKAYMKPYGTNNVTPIDVKGFGKKGIAILVDFPTSNGSSEVPGVNYDPVPIEKFNDLLNGTTYNPYDLDLFKWLESYNGVKASTNRTLKNYFNEVSYNQFGITIDVKGWYTLPNSYDYYLGQDKGYYNENGDAFVGELVLDAIKLAKDDGVDFSDYSVPAVPGDFVDLYGNATSFTDENGNIVSQIVPNVFIIHRGTGAEYSRDPSIIWSHKWDILSANYYGQYYRTGTEPSIDTLKYKVVDGVVLNVYNICPEVGQDITEFYTKPLNLPKRDPSPPYVGVFAHEFSHVLGIPDQYDYGYDSEGTGMFTIMASGSYGRDIQNRWYSGNTPVHMDAWSKYYLGFATPQVITPADGKKTITLKPANVEPDIYKIDVPGSDGKEYFMLENRQQQGYDAGLEYNSDPTPKALHGLVVWHVDESVLARNFYRPNEAPSWDWNMRGILKFTDPGTGENHYGISVVQADGRYDMERYTNDGDAGDVFPGKLGKTVLSPSIKSNPNTISFYKWGTDSRSETGLTIDNIVENSDGTVTCTVYFK